MSNSFKYSRLSKDEAACLLVDHQSGLISLVQDFSPDEFKNNVAGAGRLRQIFQAADNSDHQFRGWPERTAGAGTEGAVPGRALHRPARQHQCLGQRGFRRGSEGHGQEAADHRRHRYRGVRGVPRAVRRRGGL